MVARPRVDHSCTQKSVRYVTRVKHELNFGSALVARFCEQKPAKCTKTQQQFCFHFFEEFELPDVVTMRRLGVERVLTEVGAELICVTRSSLNLPCVLLRSPFFQLDQKSSPLQGVSREHKISDDDCGLVKRLSS